MTRHNRPIKARLSLLRGLAMAVMLGVYGLGMIGLSGVAMTVGTMNEAQAQRGDHGRGRGRGDRKKVFIIKSGRGRGRGDSRRRGRGRGR